MFDSLYQDDVDRALRLETQAPRAQPKPEPGFFSGIGRALWRGGAQGGVETGRAGLNLLEAYGKAQAFAEGAPKEESVDRLFEQSDASKAVGRVARSFDVDPATTGTAGQIVHGLAKFVAKAVGHALVEGPLAPVGFGVDEGISEGLRLADKGVDTETAIKAGVVHGGAAAASIALPVAGKTVAQTVGLTVAGGPGAFIAEQATIRGILDGANYEEISREYDPWDLTGLIVSTVGPGAFGAGAHVARGRRARRAGKVTSETKPLEGETAPPVGETRVPETVAEPVPREAVDAARVLLAREQADAQRLTPADDVAGAVAHEAAMARALDQLAAGERVDVGDVVARERLDLGRAYDLVRAMPGGEAFDPLVLLRPEDIEAVAISRGGWAGLGDAEVKGSGFGLVKFIWRHGEASAKVEEMRITRADVLEFPRVIREFAPSREAVADGSRGREWRVALPDEQGRSRTVVFAENRVDGSPMRQVVSIYVQEPGHPDAGRPLSTRKSPLNPAPEVWSPAGADTGPRVSIPRSGRSEGDASVPQGVRAGETSAPGRPMGGEHSITGEIDSGPSDATRQGAAEPASAADAANVRSESPALDAAAADLEVAQPDLLVRLDGMDEAVPLAELMARVREEAAQDLAEAPLVQTAVNCALRAAGAGS